MDFLAWYSSVHRGAGFKSRVATRAYEDARQVVGRFVGADPEDHVVIFGKNTTEALNKVAARFPFAGKGRNVVLTSLMEHHSNDLPFRRGARVIRAGVDARGRLDEADFDDKLRRHGERIALVAISGASNVTGYVNPVHRLARKAHAAGAHILVDCAQLAPHRPIDVGSLADPSHLDYVAFSAHKMYAPFGTGALVARRDVFEEGSPDMSGGGTVKVVTTESVTWADAPERDEAGSPNVVGAVAVAAAIGELERIGMDAIADHERQLTAYALGKLRRIKGLRIFGESDPLRMGERLGVITFELEDITHFLVAAVLSTEYGIGVRSGCFCAHPYVLRLLQLPDDEVRRIRAELVADHRGGMPGLVRVSFGLYNHTEEVDVLAEALERIGRREWKGKYVQDRASGEFEAVGWNPDLPQFFDVVRREAAVAVAAL
jgi:selenocysteine lyase/cysteine desulfurase